MKTILLTTSLILFVCVEASAQVSFQGLTPGVSTRADAEQALGRDIDTEYRTTYLYKPPAGLKKIKIDFPTEDKNAVIEAIHVQLEKPVSRGALVRKFELPEKSDIQLFTSDDKLMELFGGAFIYFYYFAHDASSGIESIVYNSQREYEKQCGLHPMYRCGTAASSRDALPPMPALPGYMTGGQGSTSTTVDRRGISVAGTWKGTWINSKGETGTSTLRLVEGANGTITGDEDNYLFTIENGHRTGNVLTWQYLNQVHGCRDYDVRFEISPDGTSGNGSYVVTDRCEKKIYKGTYKNYRR